MHMDKEASKLCDDIREEAQDYEVALRTILEMIETTGAPVSMAKIGRIIKRVLKKYEAIITITITQIKKEEPEYSITNGKLPVNGKW